MIQLRKLKREDFSACILNYSFSIIAKSSPFMGWNEHISRCTIFKDTYLIDYVFNESIWLSFFIRPDSDSVDYMLLEPVPPETLENLSKGAVLKLWLQLKNKYCLHASGVLVENQVILFMGAKGAGKSTTAAYFNSRGYPVWCDDYCILEYRENGYYALPGERKLRVKNETIKGLSLTPELLKPLYLPVPEIEAKTSPVSRDKSYYQNPGNCTLSQRQYHKISAIFFLSERETNIKVIIRPYNKVDGLMTLMNEIMLREIVSKKYLGYYFEETKNVLDYVDTFQVQAPDSLQQINLLFESILNQVSNEKC